MRFPMTFLLAAILCTAHAAAQDPAPAEPPAKAEEAAPDQPAAQPGLSDLSDTVQGLQDETPPSASETPPATAETPPPAAEPAPEEPAAEPAPEPTEPAAEPAQQPAEPSPEPPAAPAPAPAAPPEPLTRAQRAELDAAAARGRLLGAIARAGIVATQDMLSRVSDPEGAGIAGWLAEPEGNGVVVTFYANGDAGPVAVYRVNILGGRVQGREVFLAGTKPPLNPIQARMAAARAVAAAQEHRPCGGDQFNYFVVPPSAPDAPIDVYQVSPQTGRGRYPLGGHFRTSVAADGSVVSTRGFTNACLETTVADAPAGQQPAPIAVTHLLDPLPQEIHVFLSIWSGRPLLVVAGDPQRVFAVTPEGIAEVPR